MSNEIDLPYFDVIIDKLNNNDQTVKESFSSNVHWGYWNSPNNIDDTSFQKAGENMVQQIISISKVRDNISILDVGCGLGGTIKLINEKFHNCKIVGLNIDNRQLEVARKSVISKNDNNISFVLGDACALPFKEDGFDLILCVESIFHFKSRDIFFGEANRVLKTGGNLVVSDFVSISFFRKILNFLEKNFQLAGKTYGKLDINISISKYFQMAKNRNFSLVRIKDITKNTLPTYKYLKDNFYVVKDKEGIFKRSTTMIELVSKIGLLKYKILLFNKIK